MDVADESAEVPFRLSKDCSVGQQILSGTKNPVAAFAISLFLCGVTLPSAMNVAAGIGLSRADDLVFPGSDYFALLFGLVVSCVVVMVGVVDVSCARWLSRKGLKEAAFSCAWLSLRGVRIALGLALVFTVLAAPAFFVCFCNNLGFRILLIGALVAAPFLLVARSNSVPAEHRFCLQSDLSLRELSGSILTFAIYFAAVIFAFVLGIAGSASGLLGYFCWLWLAAATISLSICLVLAHWHIKNVPAAPFPPQH